MRSNSLKDAEETVVSTEKLQPMQSSQTQQDGQTPVEYPEIYTGPEWNANDDEALDGEESDDHIPNLFPVMSPYLNPYGPDTPESIHSVREQRPDVFKNTGQEILSLMALTLASAMGTMSLGSFIIALPTLGRYFDVDGGTLSWTMSAFSLACGSFLLFMGGIADAFGRKKVVVSSFLLFAIFCLGCGFVKTFVGLAVLRAIQGMCAAASVPAAVGMIGSLYLPGRRKNRVMATFAAGAPLGFVFGIVTGGICIQFISWRSILFFNAILYGAFTVVAYFCLPNDPYMSKEDVRQGLKTLDYGGAFLTISGFTLFVFALSQAEQAPQGWKTPYIIALLIIGVLLIIAFGFYEAYLPYRNIPSRPLMPMEVWKTRGFALCMVIVSLGWMQFIGTNQFYAALYFQDVRDVSPILSTAYFVPQAVGGILVNVFAALTLHFIPGRFLMMIAFAGWTGSSILWALASETVSYWAMPFPALLLSVVGADLAYNVANLHTLSAASKEAQSSAAGIFNTCLQLAGAIGFAASSAVVGAVTPDQDTATKAELLKGYHAGFWFSVAAAGLGLILSCFLKVGTQGGKKKPEPTGEKESV